MIAAISNLSTKQKLLLLLGIGFLLRLYVVFAAVTIAVDSVSYIALAREFAVGNFGGILNTFRPPLYPFLISVFSFVFQDFELAARMVSLVFGTFVILVSFYIGKLVANEKVGLLTALLVTLHFNLARHSGYALTESLYQFFLVSITYFTLRGVLRGSHVSVFLAGVCVAFAYLTKPGAIAILPIMSITIVFFNIKNIRHDWKKRFGLLVSAWGIFIILALPYLVYLYSQYGEVSVSGKYDIWPILLSFSRIFTEGRYIGDFFAHFPEAMSLALFPLFLWGIYRRFRDGFSKVEFWLLLTIGFYCLLYIVVGARRRYFINLMPFALVFASIGLVYIEGYIRIKFKKKAALYFTTILVILSIVNLPIVLKPIRAHRLPEKLAGRWILENYGSGVKVVTRKPIMNYYSEGVYIPMISANTAELVNDGKKQGARYLAGYPSKFVKKAPDFASEKDKFLVEVNRFDGPREEFLVYKIVNL